ncbi:Dyp-type peroxidase [Nocardioides sp. GCM10030258]|uniref:Dyp-type peroxidase n=1 Tax=unclassified Nocardioides TaxID=2615069 RepID=UPI0036146F82
MAQSKGVLPRREDREVLYANPETSAYFVGVRLASPTSDLLREWFGLVDIAVNNLVARVPAATPRKDGKGDKVASIAVGLSARVFDLLNAGITPDQQVEIPVGVRNDTAPATGWFGSSPPNHADVMFYVASTREAPVHQFLRAIASSSIVESIALDRAHQRPDATEVFGYRDGLRNVRRSDRSKVVYINTGGEQPDEPAWSDGGTYMVCMRIAQNLDPFTALSPAEARDAVIGRTPSGDRLDLVGQAVDPHDEATPWADSVPGTAHVRKAGPRGTHDDTQIYRRGMPFMGVENGKLLSGLHFCSFQANPAQFETIFSDWMLNQRFPNRPDGSQPGVDALFTPGPTGPLTEILHAGLYFVPPYDSAGLSSVLQPTGPSRAQKPGRLAITKRVLDPTDANARFERGGFHFHLEDDAGSAVPGSEFVTASSGRGVCPAELEIGRTYTLVESAAPVGLVVNPVRQPVPIDRPNVHAVVINQLQQPTLTYGSV